MMATSTSHDGELNEILSLMAGLLTAGAVHGLKATARPAVTVTTAGLGNPLMSVLEDFVAVVAAVVAVVAPLLILLLVPLLAWLLWRVYDRLRRSGTALRQLSRYR